MIAYELVQRQSGFSSEPPDPFGREWNELCLTRIVPDLCDGESDLPLAGHRQVPVVTGSLSNVTGLANIYPRSTA